MRGIGKEILIRMDLDAEVRAACTETTGADYVTRKGRRILSMEADMMDGDGPIAEIEILRGDISEVLYDATRGSAGTLSQTMHEVQSLIAQFRY